jgi:hypothetical protein
MCGQNVSFAFSLLLLALAPRAAEAKELNFTSGLPVGIGIVGGLEGKPGNDFVAGTQSSGSAYSSYASAEPFVEFVNVQFRLHAGWHFYPLLSGSGSDSKGTFTEGSNAGSLELGARILLAPYVAEDLRHRAYFVVGLNDSTAKLKNRRKYSTGSMAGQTNTEQLAGSGTEFNVGVGYEFFLLQNYSLALEGGYRTVTVESLHYSTSTDTAGNTVSSGATATNGQGGNKTFHVHAPYAQLVLNLNL